MHTESRQYAISTDQLGLFGQSVKNLQDITPRGLTEIPLVEITAKRPIRAMRNFMTQLERAGYTIAQIHGRTGRNHHEPWFDSLKLRIYELISPSTEELIEAFPDKEILIHRPEAENPEVFAAIVHYKPAFIWIENHLGPQELEKSLALVERLTNLGVRAAVMFDAGHYVVDQGDGTQFRDRWNSMLEKLQEFSEQNANIQGIHLCIGSAWDNIHLEELRDHDLVQLAQILDKFPLRTVVYENQQDGITGLLGEKMLHKKELRTRSEGILQRLSFVGLAPQLSIH